MTAIEYLKRQAKNLQKDFKTKTFTFDPKQGYNVYYYDPKFFKIDRLIEDFEIDEENFKLGNAQHLIAKLCGLEKWSDLLSVSSAKMELSILLYNNMDRVEVRDWNEYVADVEIKNSVQLDDEFRLKIFKEVFLEGEQDVYYDSYRLFNDEEIDIDWEQEDFTDSIPSEKLSSLPLIDECREEFIESANYSFERIMKRIEPNNPEITRSLWNAEYFIDKELLKPEMLPIDKDYALSLVDSFLVNYVIQLAVEADELVNKSK